jgi:hypothetical protein
MKYLKAVLNGSYSRFLSLTGMLLTSVRNTASFPCRVSDWNLTSDVFYIVPQPPSPFDVRCVLRLCQRC